MATKSNLNKDFIPTDQDLKELHKKLGIEDEDNEINEEVEDIEVDDTSEDEEIEEDSNDEEVVFEKPVKKPTKKPNTKKTSTAKKTTKPIKEMSPLDVLDKIEVDMNSIIINDNKTDLDKIDDFEFVLNDKSTYQVVLNQSCYVAHMQGLRLADINMLNNSTGGLFETQYRKYQVLHKMINTSSIGKIDFKTFLNITSYFDLPTLYFGTYMETFPGKTEFTITCGHCKRKIDVKIDNESFIAVRDDNIYSHMDEILRSVNSPESALRNSLVNKIERRMLPKSKIIVEIQTPSLNDHLNLLSSIKEDKVDEIRNMLLTLLFIKKLYFPDVREIKKQGKPVYFSVNKRDEIFRIIRDLSPEDVTELGNSIGQRIDKYSIEYKIKSFKCTNCHEEVGDIPVDIEELLFQEILRL